MGNSIFKKNVEIKLTDGIYKGDVIKDRNKYILHGKCVINYNNGNIFKGNFFKNKKEGYGIMKDIYGFVYKGNWINDKFINGTIKFNNYLYQGYIYNNNPDGKGVMIFNDKSKYEGTFIDGRIEGSGYYYDSNGKLILICKWKNNLPNGNGFMLIDGKYHNITLEDGQYKYNDKLYRLNIGYNPFDHKVKYNIPNDNKIICNICFENEKNILFLPCKHLCSCIDCSKNLNRCPICNKKIKKKINFYLS